MNLFLTVDCSENHFPRRHSYKDSWKVGWIEQEKGGRRKSRGKRGSQSLLKRQIFLPVICLPTYSAVQIITAIISDLILVGYLYEGPLVIDFCFKQILLANKCHFVYVYRYLLFSKINF